MWTLGRNNLPVDWSEILREAMHELCGGWEELEVPLVCGLLLFTIGGLLSGTFIDDLIEWCKIQLVVRLIFGSFALILVAIVIVIVIATIGTFVIGDGGGGGGGVGTFVISIIGMIIVVICASMVTAVYALGMVVWLNQLNLGVLAITRWTVVSRVINGIWNPHANTDDWVVLAVHASLPL